MGKGKRKWESGEGAMERKGEREVKTKKETE